MSLTNPKPPYSLFHPFLMEASRNQFLALTLLVLSVADLLMTYVLLQSSPHFYESNPIAQWFFANWNMKGMVAYKFIILAIIVTLSEVIERNLPKRGQIVLAIGCIATMMVFGRGLYLYLHMGE